MKFTLRIHEIKSITEIDGYWTTVDYINLLDELDFPNAKDSTPGELRELLEMAITDFEPHESAQILLRYKLKEKLSNGQILNLSHEMADDNEAEENPDIDLHYPLFNINQLLYKAYNGIFPYAKATSMTFELIVDGEHDVKITRAVVLKAVGQVLSDKTPLKRLFENQLKGKEPFPEAEKIIWELHKNGDNQYTVITSDYWINEEDILEEMFTGSINSPG